MDEPPNFNIFIAILYQLIRLTKGGKRPFESGAICRKARDYPVIPVIVVVLPLKNRLQLNVRKDSVIEISRIFFTAKTMIDRLKGQF
tara:strand:- start:57069 stop:57329 length:261 start_codon:yes stop_codon:yes gene_type:complete